MGTDAWVSALVIVTETISAAMEALSLIIMAVGRSVRLAILPTLSVT